VHTVGVGGFGDRSEVRVCGGDGMWLEETFALSDTELTGVASRSAWRATLPRQQLNFNTR
jgi:hypothetical protein